jgi:hypothetical protein
VSPKKFELTELTGLTNFCNNFFVGIVKKEPFISVEGTSLILTLSDLKLAGVYKL